MKIRELAVPDSYAVDLIPHGDGRGRLVEWYRADVLTAVRGAALPLAQANHSVSSRGVLRGVHFAQVPPGQAKWIYCPVGRVLDVVVDLRLGSPTFGVHDTVVLDAERPTAVYLAEGLGHAFVALTDASSVTYLVSAPYDPAREFAVHPMDPDLDLPWPTDMELHLSARDREAPTLAQLREQGVLPGMAECDIRYQELRAASRPGDSQT